jgi:tRNA threonylcarbamoyladenosine biosynthesis protein TsaB
VSLILNIDTAVQTSSVCISKNDQSLGLKVNPSQKESASWIHLAIDELSKEININLSQLDAISVSEGPGSYTGLRVGMATAKGLCYALSKPLLTINTLKMMAVAAKDSTTDFLCPMIDARRMEVFAAVYDKSLNDIQSPINIVLDEHSFSELLKEKTITFFGNGSDKFKAIIKHQNAFFQSLEMNVLSMISLSYGKFVKQDFTDLAYSQPFYGKDFHSPAK